MKNASKHVLNFSLRLSIVALLASCAANGNNGSGAARPETMNGTVPSPPTAPTLAGTSDTGGGDWFVHPLPILKFQFPADGGVVEGVRYQRFDLPRCDETDAKRGNPEYELVALFPGAGFTAVKVQTSFNEIVCSYGVVETEPTKALQLLVNNEDTNKDRTFQGHIMDSKVYGGPAVIGNFLLTMTADNKIQLFSNHFTNLKPQERHFFTLRKSERKAVDAIYVPVDIEKSDRTYFAHNVFGNWRLILPVPIKETQVPLRGYAAKLVETFERRDATELDLLNRVSLPEGFPSGAVPAWTTVAQIFSTLLRTSGNAELITKFNEKYGVDLKVGDTDGYEALKIISEKFSFEFSPTVGLTEIHRASFHSSAARTKFALPLLNPTWRVVADMIHEMTHAVQEHSSNDSQEQRFKNELEAHLNERAYLASLAEKYPVIKDAIASQRAIVAAGVPNVEFVDAVADVKSELALCENILKSYNLSRDRISPEVLAKAGCRN